METGEKPPRQLIVKLEPATAYNGVPGVRVMLACGHVVTMHGLTIDAKDGTLECRRCLPARQCAWCEEPVLDNEPMAEHGDAMYHEECEVREFQGPASHFMQECPCFGGTRGDPPGMSKRDSARLALEARSQLIAAQGEATKAAMPEFLARAFREGRVVDLGTFRVRDDGTLEPNDEDDDEDEDEDDED